MEQGGWIYLLLPILLLLWLFTRTRRQQREIIAIQDRVTVGAEVMMTSGIYGTVVQIGDDGIIDVEIAPGLRTRWQRQAVARVIDPAEAADAADAADQKPAPADEDPPPSG